LSGIALARGLYFAFAMLLFGSAAFGALLRQRLPVIAAVRLPRLWLLPPALLAACAWFVLAAAEMAGAMDSNALTQAATGTLFGQVFILRIGLLLGLIFVPSRNALVTALLAAGALALPAATSHAAAASPAGFAAIGATLDAVHLLTAGFWIGGLAVLAALRRRKEPNILLALSLFSDGALVAVLLLVMTGLINAASILLGDKGAPAPLYLTVLGAKLALVLAMLGLAAVNRFRLMPRGQDRAIARNAAIELGLGFIIVLLAGALGQLSPTL
jgi:putative copper resistance protein D